MIAYGRIGSKVWKAVTSFRTGSKAVAKDNRSFLDFRMQKWQKAIPAELQFRPSEDFVSGISNRSLYRLRVLLYLRSNYMRMLVHRQNLLSTNAIFESLTTAQLVV